MHAEEEARKKWCPFVRLGNVGGCNMSGPREAMGQAFCIASACMAWRWAYERIESDHPYEEGYTQLSKTIGYCGLACQP